MGDLLERIIRHTRDMAISECIDEINKYCLENNIPLGRGQSNDMSRIRSILEKKCIKINHTK